MALEITPTQAPALPAHVRIEDAFARRGFGFDRHTGARVETTFVSADRADNDPLGWFHGYVEDGALWFTEGSVAYRLTHVAEGSWRCGEPVMVGAGERRAA